jgi:phosphoribosylformylglycinamidine cyclo-ligase
MRSPVLVSSVDGVGTKLIVAQAAGRHDTVGEDLVNHCVNDIAVCGATPLFFLDYFATGKLRVDVAADVIRGFAKACRENRCSLIGGETAEMPGMYGEDHYDLAGTIVGVVDRKSIVDGKKVRKGDVLIGLPSTGLHTNGYSLARAVLLRQHTLSDRIEELGTTLADALLAVHRSYLRPVQRLLRTGFVRGLAHITGGGIVGNTRRVLPSELTLAVDWDAWERPPLFRLIQRLGEVPEDDMRRTFNCGIGLIAIVARASADRVLREMRTMRERAFIVGEVVSGKDGER